MTTKTLRVLHVEDDPLDARLVRDMLANSSQPSIKLTHVDYLSDAKQSVRDHNYDVALLDLMLPDQKGLPSILTLRAAAPTLPIVVYTSLPSLGLAREAIRAGAEDYAVKGHTDALTLVHKLCTAVDRYQLKHELYSQLDLLNSENRTLNDLSYHDPLTGLYNRRGLEQRLRNFAKPAEQDIFATLVDVDDFKQINDQHGHHVGDQVLQELAQAMVACSQSSEVLARVGGDEFLVVGKGGRDAAIKHGGCLQQALARDPVLQRLQMDHPVTCCQAITLLGRRSVDLPEVLASAHASLAHGKVNGKDNIIGEWMLSSGAAPR